VLTLSHFSARLVGKAVRRRQNLITVILNGGSFLSRAIAEPAVVAGVEDEDLLIAAEGPIQGVVSSVHAIETVR